MKGRVLAVDPGDQRIGIALSDPTGTVANPLIVIKHVSRIVDAAQVAELARNHQVVSIVIGQAMGSDGELTPQARKAQRFADALRAQTDLPIYLWDESGSTQAARSARIAMQVSRRKRSGHLDELAAAVILQSYLDANLTGSS